MEAVEFRHLSFQLRQVHQRIDLIRQQYRFLFVNTLLVGTDLDKKIGTRDGRTGSTWLWLHLLLTLSPTLPSLRLTRDGNLQLIGRHTLTLSRNMGRRNSERTVLDGYDNIGKGNGRRLTGVTVDNLKTRL